MQYPLNSSRLYHIPVHHCHSTEIPQRGEDSLPYSTPLPEPVVRGVRTEYEEQTKSAAWEGEKRDTVGDAEAEKKKEDS